MSAEPMKLVIFNGAMCSGKSTVIEKVLSETRHCFHLSYDALKWQFSGYASGLFYEDIRVLRLGMLRTLCQMRYHVITESLHQESRQKHIELARSFQYEVMEINIEAAYDVLLKRWEERNALGRREDTVPRTRFDEIYQIYIKEKSNNVLTFRTDRQSVGEIADHIVKLF